MWKLTIEDDEQRQTPLSLAHDEYAVGRDETNSIVLTDRNVSRKHAFLRRNETGWLVKDLDSQNGTFVNGLRLEGEQHVGHGDIIQLGDYRLELFDDARDEALAQQNASASLPFHQRPDRLVVVVGPTPGQEFSLDKEYFTIGRSEEAMVSINHSSVSRLHAELFAIGNGRFEIIDKGSANGVRINGQEVRRGLLEAGDALELGDVRMRFVGAGKIFRAGTDRQTSLPAIVGFGGPQGVVAAAPPTRVQSVPPVAAGRGILKMVLLGAILGAVTVGIVAFFLTRGGSQNTVTPPTTNSARSDDPAQSTIEEAKRLFSQGYIEDAHQKIQNALERSPGISDPAIAEIEGKWADKILAEVEKTTNVEEKKILLRRIVQTTSVDADRRKNALAQLQSVDPSADDTLMTAAPNRPFPPSTERVPSSPGTTTTAKPTASAKDAGPGDARTNAKGVIDSMLGRLGSLSAQELDQLVQLCYQERNQGCRQAAQAQLAKLQKDK